MRSHQRHHAPPDIKDRKTNRRLRCEIEWPAGGIRTIAGQALKLLALRKVRNVHDVHDDGIGFDPGSAPPRTGDRRTHLGLVVLHERTKLCGGEVVLTSRPGKGTRVRMRFPVTGETPVY